MKLKAAAIIPAVVSIVGCASPVPVASNFPISYQRVAHTAHHWDVVANDVVEQTTAALQSKEELQGRGVYVLPAPRNTAFDNAFRNFMINHMVNRDLRVAVCKNETPATSATKGGFEEVPDVVVRYETQVIGHRDELPNYAPGRFTALASGVAVLRNADHANLTRGQANAAGILFGALTDWGLGHVSIPTRTELIVTTTIAEGNRFILRRSDIYYVPDGDVQLFFRQISQRSPCSQGNTTALSKSSEENFDVEAEKQLARSKMIDTGMRRYNPDYQPKTFVGSF